MNILESIISASHSYPLAATFITGIVLTLFAVGLYKLEKRQEFKNREKKIHLAFVEHSVQMILFAENIRKSNLTSATLLDDVVKTVEARAEKGLRKTWKAVDDSRRIRNDCDAALREMEKIAEALMVGTLTYGQLGTTDIAFADILDYFRENFPII
jgi:hypothetical protein